MLNELRVRFSGGSIKMAGTLRGAWLPGLLPARKNPGRRWTNFFFGWPKETAAGEHGWSVSAGAE